MKPTSHKLSKPARTTTPAPNKLCLTCGSPFYASPGHTAQGWGKFCSFPCRTKAFAGSEHPSWLGEEWNRNCEACGAQFRVKPSALARRRRAGRFCSAACAKTRFPVKPVVNCEKCGKAFEIYACHVTRRGGRKFCSRLCSTLGHRPRNKYCSGRRPDLGNQYFRSKWEANWARYLNWLKDHRQIKGWAFEEDTFEFPYKRGTRFYVPDFKVTNNNDSIEYQEVKGYMDEKSRVKLKRMAKHYPAVKVIVIDTKTYRDMARKIGHGLPGWEESRDIPKRRTGLQFTASPATDMVNKGEAILLIRDALKEPHTDHGARHWARTCPACLAMGRAGA